MEASNSLIKIHQNILTRYEEPVHITGSLYHRVDKKVNQLTSYMASEFTHAQKTYSEIEELYKQPFLNVMTQVRDVESRAVSIKRKNIEGYAIDEDYVFSMVVEKEVQEEFDYLVMATFLKDFQEGKIEYGTALLVVTDCDNEIGYKLEIAEFANTKVDPFNIDGGKKLFTHQMDFMSLEDKREIWNDSSIDELIDFAEDNDEQSVSVDHIEGVMRECDITGVSTDDKTYEYYEVYVGVCDEALFLMDYNKLDEKRVYAFNREARPGNKTGQGIGALEEVIEEQVWINDTIASMQESIQLGSKVGVKTNIQGLPSVMEVDNGFHVEMKDNEYYDPFTFDMPQINYASVIDVYFENLRRKASMHEAVTGEEQKAGTPYAGQALQSAQASSIFDYRREKDGQDVIWILDNIILPRMVKRLNKDHELNASFSPQQKALIDNATIEWKIAQDILDKQTFPLPGEMEEKRAELLAEQSLKGDRRTVHVPKGYITMEKIRSKMRWRITSDTDDVQNKINNLVAQMQSLQPEDPARVMMMNEVMELSGQSPAQFRPQLVGNAQQPGQQSNLQAQISEVTPEAQK